MGCNSFILLVFCALIANAFVTAELTPPYFNLATGRKIYATATCGVNTDGPELYCKLVGANTENDHIDYSVIQGQVCDICDPKVPEKSHPPELAIDGTEAWWQSPPLSRGMKYNEVNLTIDFGQEFHVAYIFIRMGNSPRPGLWTMEKSTDYGKTWVAWQHFSDTPADCETYFGKDTFKPITQDDDAICTTEYSKIVPLENGEIPVMLLNNRPSANNYFNSTVLQEWTRATNVRIRLLRTKNLLGHLMSVARQDPTVTRRYFYSIKDISIGGRCMCNGHADTCDVLDPKSAVRILACRCQHRTCGIQCNQCCPGFEQKKWRQNTNASPFQCEPCNCHGHSNDCTYEEEIDLKGLSLDIHSRYEGGGLCRNCQHNTEGINCNICKPKYYRPFGKYWNETDVCTSCQCEHFYSTGHCEEETGRCECRKEFKPPNCDSCAYGFYGYPNCRECECNLNGTDGYHCETVDGDCPCKINFAGHYCKQCSEGYYAFPDCKPCQCNKIGSINNDCELETGNCKCLSSFGGDNCERCKHGYYSYPKCQYCDCDIEGTESYICDKESGRCICRNGFGGPRCDQCLPGFYNYPNCKSCNCSAHGSTAATCDNTGKCNCLPNFAGKQCTLCSAGYFSYPECLPCNCDVHGSEGVTCNADGQCLCLPNFNGKLCDSCQEGYYNFPNCEGCNCDPAGVIHKFAGCGSVPVGELCQCKERVAGRICNECKPLYWNLNVSNSDGCEVCDCHIDGTIAGLDTCLSKTGQCTCKPHVQGRQCIECKDGSFDLEGGSLFGCKDCNCDVGGSWKTDCEKSSGQCQCHPRITGRTCTQPLTTHYFPTLYQFQYEYEDGSTASGAQVRYQYDDVVFPDFSSKGYAIFSDVQNEVRNELMIIKSSVYRIVIRYVNPTNQDFTANIHIQSENPLEVDQNAKVLLRPTLHPQFVTVSGAKGTKPAAIVLDPGKYAISTKTSKNVMLDYFVLLPAAYYEASILTRKINNPCELDSMELCRHYKYVSVNDFKPAVVPFIVTANNVPTNPTEFYSETDHLTIINHVGDIPVLSRTQNDLKYILDLPHSGRYIFVIDYITEKNYQETYFIKIRLGEDKENFGSALLYPCLYSMACRQPIIDDESREKYFYMSTQDLKPVVIYNDFDDFGRVAIISITAIPVEKWSIDYIIPSPVCVIHDGKCSAPKFRSVPDSKKIEFETDHDDQITKYKPPYAALDEKIKLINLNQQNSTIVIESMVSEPGRYVVLLKYYQPYYPKYKVLYVLSAGKLTYDGKFDIAHCPSSSGCRGVIHPSGDDWWFDIEYTFKFTITNTNPQDLWLDYLIVVPVDQFNDDLLVEETFDQTKEFIKNCGQDHFYITYNATEFCKKAVFSLTADYNGGALPCNCDYDGSTSFECDPFGGQCQCKPNVIERQCGACRTGFYGFPDCKPCDCPITAMCESHTGECVCPPHVTGEKCNQCMPFTYGFHQIIGCEECNCNYLGVENGNAQCDMLNGSCECRPNIEGRSCDQCSNGYFNFPRCNQCGCNTAGTENEVCDKIDGNCFCKKNVVGRDCEQCIDGTYNLQTTNQAGCTTCFCFGKTSRCDSAYLRLYNISLLNNVSLNNLQLSKNSMEFEEWEIPPDDILVNETTLQADFSIKDPKDETLVYFGVIGYLFNQNSHLTSYGGDLTYSLYYATGLFGKALLAPDVILFGKNQILVHQSYEQPSSDQIFTNRVKMIEGNFQTIEGNPVSRADFMMALRDLKAIYIRANYWEQTVISQLSDVYLTLADEDEENYNLYLSLPVERCHCPPGYKGLSCEDCAPGYYRDPNGPYGGYCIPCECYGHAETCDCITGACKNCEHSTTGHHCEFCDEGYYGNATYGSPHDCMICACPLPYASNNFATGCEISESGHEIHCECKPGYTGPRCESCASGFFGDPEKRDDYCKPCECSGNINLDEPGSCDTKTGECLLCLNNTWGAACNLCAPGFYGDAIKLKNCKSCDCDEMGTLECDPFVGDCKCHSNVVGNRCDHCMPDYYGFDSGFGCKPCECGVASHASQCDDHTGKCACKTGVNGRQCDRCAVDYWNYTEKGCSPCLCNQGYSRGFGCNPMTGQCECLPGVIGDRCDACPHRWILIKDEGCRECDACHHDLLDVTDRLRHQIDPVIEEFQSVALAFFTSQKLNYYNGLEKNIGPEVQALDPKGVNLNPARSVLAELEAEAKMLGKQVNHSIDNALESRYTAHLLLKNVSAIYNQSRYISGNAREAILTVEALVKNLDTAASTKIDAAFIEADHVLQQINQTQIDLKTSKHIFEKAAQLLAEIDILVQPIKIQNKTLNSLKDDIGEFSDKLEDLFDWSVAAANKSAEVQSVNALNKLVFENSKFYTVADQQKAADLNIEDAKKFLINGDLTLNSIDKQLDELKDVFDQLKKINQNVDNFLPENEQEHFDSAKVTADAEARANMLSMHANNLYEQYSDITASSEPAIKAATAYTDMFNAVASAHEFSKEAKYDAVSATQLCDGIEGRAGIAAKDSGELLRNAHSALIKAQTDLHPHLTRSSAMVKSISALNQRAEKKLEEINLALEQIPVHTQRIIWEDSNEKAADALDITKKVLHIIDPVVRQTPTELIKARNISKDIDTTTKDISQISSQIENVKTTLPELSNLSDNLAKKQVKIEENGLEVGKQIENLKRQIETARQIANEIKVGVKFIPSTILELKTPETLPLLATKSKVSAYFNTEKPNGFLMFLGNDNKTTVSGTGTNKNDFMALEILNGYPILTIDLGNGPERITNEKYVADGNWYQTIIDRTGANAKLIIREELDNGTVLDYVAEEHLVGSNNVFNVDRNSRLFVGGYPPPSDFTPPEDIRSSSFVGEIEDLRIGDEHVGLWNFVDGQDNNQGARARNKLINENVPPTGYRFNGNGYVSVKASQHNFKARSSIQFSFKAAKDAKDGLLFFYGRHNHFMTVELENGAVFFRYQLGEHMVSTGSDNTYNDNKWHRVIAERDGRRGLLKVDDALIFQEETPPGSDENMPSLKRMFFGGYPGKRNHSIISEKNFDGCIDDVTVSGVQVDLGQHLNAFGVKAGCPAKFSTSLSFPPHEYGFLRKSNISSLNNFQINLKFKTRQLDGIIFYATNHDQSSSIGLTLNDGILALNSMKNTLNSDPLKLNDGEWHAVTVQHDHTRLRLSVGDSNEYQLHFTPEPLEIYNGDIFFGGLPDSYLPARGAISTSAYFVGCINDVTIQGEIINFASSTEKVNGNINGCPSDIIEYDVAGVQNYFPGDGNARLPEIIDSFMDNELIPIEPASPRKAPTSPTIATTTATPKQRITTLTSTSIRTLTTTTTATSTTTNAPELSVDIDLPTKKPKLPKVHPSNPRCKLSEEPDYDVDFSKSGYRFFSMRSQRLEIPSLPVKMRKHYDVSMQFRTGYSSGLLFYAADKRQTDFIAVYLYNGHVYHQLRAGPVVVNISSTAEVNDGEWHTVEFVRTLSKASLIIDGVEEESSAKLDERSSRAVVIEFPIFIGGVPTLREEDLNNVNAALINGSYFNGCLRNIQFNKNFLDKVPTRVGVVSCTDDIEKGIFFSKSSGYIKVFDNFTVGTEMNINFDFKPRTTDGLLFSAHGRNAYMILELVNDTLVFSVKSDHKNLIEASYTLNGNETFCDGKWRNVQAVKSKFVITLTVDSISSSPAIGTEGSTMTKTNRPLFMGGHHFLGKAVGLKTRQSFKGCIRNLIIKGKQVRIIPDKIHGEIWPGICPTH